MSLIILAPEMPKPAPEPIRPVVVVDRFDRKLLTAVESHGDQPAPVWILVHQIIHDENPPSRTHRRMLVARLLCRVRSLIRAGRIERDGKAHVRLREPGKPTPTHAPMTPDDIRRLEAKAQDAIEAAEAGSAMAMRRWHDLPLPRAARIWTGMLAGKRAWRGQPVVLPDKTIAYIFCIQRGWAALWRPAPFKVAGREELLLPGEQIAPYKLSCAQRLGRCKAAHRGAPSARKAEACRKNGAMLVQPGHRPRGRPRKGQSITDPPGHHPPTRPAHPDRPGRTPSCASGGIPPACP